MRFVCLSLFECSGAHRDLHSFPTRRSSDLEGQAAAILAVAQATAEGIRKVADTIRMPGGFEAVQLRVAEQYIGQFGELAKAANTLVLPATVSDVGSMIALAMNVIGRRAGSAAGAPSA